MSTNDPPSAVLESIKENSEYIHKHSSRLTKQLETIEEWLSKLPGKLPCEAVESLDTPNGEPLNLTIQFDREGRFWSLKYCYEWPMMPDAPVWKRLCDAPLDVKFDAAKMMPALLENLVNKQRARINEIAVANERLDSLAAVFGTMDLEDENVAS